MVEKRGESGGMKRRRIKAVKLYEMLFLCLVLCGCQSVDYCVFDVEKEGIVDVAIWEAYGEEKQLAFYTLASGKRICPTEAFETESMTVYEVPIGCFSNNLSKTGKQWEVERAAFYQHLSELGQGNQQLSDIQQIMNEIEMIDHALLWVRIMEVEKEYFVNVALNVNLWTPCTLYYFRRDMGEMIELYQWDDRRVEGIRIRSLDF